MIAARNGAMAISDMYDTETLRLQLRQCAETPGPRNHFLNVDMAGCWQSGQRRLAFTGYSQIDCSTLPLTRYSLGQESFVTTAVHLPGADRIGSKTSKMVIPRIMSPGGGA